MRSSDDLRDQHLYDEISQITNDYGALYRRTVRELARCKADLARAHSVLGTVAHDLRTPLAAVVGFTELLLDDADLTPAQRDLNERVDRAARVMTALTEELVEAATASGSPLSHDPVNLSLVLRHVVARHQLLKSPRGVQVVIDKDLTQGAPTILNGDEGKLERLVENLVSNAAKFSPPGGEVRVSVTHDSRTAEIRVSDDGPGLPAEQVEQVFAPFHRAPDAADIPGVGLGLTIVKQVAERHGGSVHVESVPGAGATFVVRLPLASRLRTPPDQ